MSVLLHMRRASIGLTGTVLIATLILCPLLFPSTSYSGEWRVTPARIFLDQEAKSSVITVMNTGDEPVNFQIKAMEWSQDAEGKDQYKETKDIVFFPKILLVPKKEQKIIRAGIKVPPAAKEKTYRLFIEEIPQPKKSDQGDVTQISIAVRFGVPIFVKPFREELRGELLKPALAKGVFTVTVKNTGNTHFRISDITVTGKNVRGVVTFSTKVEGWYSLNGTARTYAITLPGDKCAESAVLDILVTTDKQLKLNGNLNVEKALCMP